MRPSKASAVTAITPVPPLFKADREIRLAFSAVEGKIGIVSQSWDDAKIALEGQVFEISLGAARS